LTVVAFGTSAPEMFVSVGAALKGAGGLAIGNVIGSNIANVLLVIGLPSLISPTNCNEAGIGRNIIVMLGFTVVFMGMVWEGGLERYDGLILLALLALFIFDQFQSAQKHRNNSLEELAYHDEIGEAPHSNLMIAALITFGIVALPVGADLTVKGATAALKVNGKPAWQTDGIETRRGYIALQAEVPGGGQFLFRNIRITELKPAGKE